MYEIQAPIPVLPPPSHIQVREEELRIAKERQKLYRNPREIAKIIAEAQVHSQVQENGWFGCGWFGLVVDGLAIYKAIYSNSMYQHLLRGAN